MTALWVGGMGGMEADLVQHAGVAYEAIPAAGVHGVGLRTLPGNISQLARGVFASRRILKRFKPDVLLFTGGYVAAPMAVAGARIPSLLFVPDIEPGLALKFISRTSRVIAVTAEESRKYFSTNKVLVTGYPVRDDLKRWTKVEARKILGLHATKPTLLVFGGSKGARSINRAVAANLNALMELGIQLVHISGELDFAEASAAGKNLSADHQSHYHLYPYLHEEMGAALASADLVVSRAGASALGEYPAFGLPAVLVPYPYAWRYQKVNADYLASQGAALILPDEKLTSDLLTTVHTLLANPSRLAQMGAAMSHLAKPNAAAEIGQLLRNLATGRGASHG